MSCSLGILTQIIHKQHRKPRKENLSIFQRLIPNASTVIWKHMHSSSLSSGKAEWPNFGWLEIEPLLGSQGIKGNCPKHFHRESFLFHYLLCSFYFQRGFSKNRLKMHHRKGLAKPLVDLYYSTCWEK